LKKLGTPSLSHRSLIAVLQAVNQGSSKGRTLLGGEFQNFIKKVVDAGVHAPKFSTQDAREPVALRADA
jgi:hypothetical protein